MEWDIHPDQVRGVLARTASTASEFDSHVTAMRSEIEGAAGQASSGIIGQALTGFAEARGPDMQFVFSRIQTAIGGASTAVGAYLQGDHDMVLNAQRGVSNAPDPREHMPGGGRR
ncbi:DUF6507 family protein [Saccharopolyspora sp. SCSIO 74807]|uniref:DUF6507 family protein n=1 Tax=Saccharopolyspora sp. SCSIO 74807 TaxID=3118084 RepID=UPI0030D5D967